MDMQHILTLIQAVSDSSLSGFALEEGDFRLSLSRGGQPLTGAMEPQVSCAGKPGLFDGTAFVQSGEQWKS